MMTAQPTQARLVLEDGSVYSGLSTGASGTTFGEIVFNTCMTGYQEILTDPSYSGQMVVMTAPEIGNYGVNTEDIESSSASISVSGFITRKLSPIASNWRSNGTLANYLSQNGVVGICGVDTRAITRRIRTAGAMKAGITNDTTLTTETFLDQIRSQPRLSDQDWVAKVSCKSVYTLTQSKTASHTVDKLVVIDFGIKQGILRYLKGLVVQLVVYPITPHWKRSYHSRLKGCCCPMAPEIQKIAPVLLLWCSSLWNVASPPLAFVWGIKLFRWRVALWWPKCPLGTMGETTQLKTCKPIPLPLPAKTMVLPPCQIIFQATCWK